MRFLDYHLGLGDAILCSGLVNKLSQKEEIVIPCYLHNYKSVRDIYLGNPNVRIMIVNNINDIQYIKNIIYPGKSTTLNGNDFPKGFYRQAGVEWEERWGSCPVFDASEMIHPKIDLVGPFFIHDDASRGFNINVNGIRCGSNDFSILSYIPYLSMCREIHCIDSSFLHLVECIPVEKFKNNTKFFYHKSARPGSMDYTGCLRHNWNVL